MVLNNTQILAIFLVGLALAGCVGSNGLDQSFKAELPVEGMITFSD